MKRHRVAATCFLGIALLVLLASAAPAQTPPLLDNFNRPDEDPLSGGGNWAQTDSGGWPTPMRLLNNSATRGTNTSASYWTQMSFQGGEGSVWARSGNLGVGGAPGVGIALYKEVGGASAADGYEFRRTAGGAAGSRRDAARDVRRVDHGCAGDRGRRVGGFGDRRRGGAQVRPERRGRARGRQREAGAGHRAIRGCHRAGGQGALVTLSAYSGY